MHLLMDSMPSSIARASYENLSYEDWRTIFEIASWHVTFVLKVPLEDLATDFVA